MFNRKSLVFPLFFAVLAHAGVLAVISFEVRQVDLAETPSRHLVGVSMLPADSAPSLPASAHPPVSTELSPKANGETGGPPLAAFAAPAAPPAPAGNPNHARIDEQYTLEVRSRIEAKLRYPLALRRRGVEGRVTLKLTLGPNGELETQDILQSSGSDELDALALEAAQSAAPYPVPPDPLAGPSKLVLSLPIEFKIH